MTTTGRTAGQRALDARRRERRLPAIAIEETGNPVVDRSLQAIAEHMQIFEGDVRFSEHFGMEI